MTPRRVDPVTVAVWLAVLVLCALFWLLIAGVIGWLL